VLLFVVEQKPPKKSYIDSKRLCSLSPCFVYSIYNSIFILSYYHFLDINILFSHCANSYNFHPDIGACFIRFYVRYRLFLLVQDYMIDMQSIGEEGFRALNFDVKTLPPTIIEVSVKKLFTVKMNLFSNSFLPLKIRLEVVSCPNCAWFAWKHAKP